MARERSPVPRSSPRELLFESWYGRLFLGSAAVRLATAGWRIFGAAQPGVVRIIGAVATIGLIVAAAVFAWDLFVQVKRRLLWRVRRKLILSYIFIGVVPALLILVFFLFAGYLVFMNVSAYLFKDGFDKIIEDTMVSAQAAATEIARNPASVRETVDRVHRIRAVSYPDLSVAYLAPDGTIVTAGPWRRIAAPRTLPHWVRDEGFSGAIGMPVADSPAEEDLIVRSVVKVGAGGIGGAVVVDVPVTDQVTHRLHDGTGVRLENVFDSRANGGALQTTTASGDGGRTVLFERSLAQLDVRDWRTGVVHRDTLALAYRLRELYGHLSSAQSITLSGMRLSDALVWMLVLIGVLFLIIEAVALVMGLALARSITSSVHELFMGTERVRHGDFTHRIHIESRDQLGELASSFNQMTGSIENLLQTKAEKKRLEEELRIARQIQMSLLPRGPLSFEGVDITALCVPAREVGGDYYDFFPLGDQQLGILIADVAGKGTSAALYMAELKGLMLSLSQIYRSPRQLLIEVNRIISENLDTRSFITMTYAVLDQRAGRVTFARAGHTPALFLDAESPDEARVLIPSGIVVGLRIPGAMEKFAALLEETTLPLGRGDVMVLYTDGITEAMNPAGDLFGENRLARLIGDHRLLDAGQLRERILRDVESFVGAADPHDDMTMILIKVESVAASQAVAV